MLVRMLFPLTSDARSTTVWLGIWLLALSVVPVQPAIARTPDLAAGQDVYFSICVSCHGPDGHGADTHIPSFIYRERLEKDDVTLRRSIRDGVPDRMPPWGGYLDDDRIADVLAYIRHRFGGGQGRR
jgi:mono/diheme cytochrome c family protein